MGLPRFTQQALDAIQWLVDNFEKLKAIIGASATTSPSTEKNGRTKKPLASRPVALPLTTGLVIAEITSHTTLGIGWFNATFYGIDPLLVDITTAFTIGRVNGADAGATNRFRIGEGYVLSLEIGATERTLDPGMAFQCVFFATHTDGKRIALLIGNPVGYGDCGTDP